MAPPSVLFDGIAAWLMQRALQEADLGETVREFGRKLVAGGLSIHRIAIGGMFLHPVFGARDIVWEARHDTLRSSLFPRSEMVTPDFQNAPFFHMASHQVPFQRYRLDQGLLEREFPIFARLRQAGVTDYFTFFKSFGRAEAALWAQLPAGMEGVTGSFSTRRIGGFAEADIEYLTALAAPLALAVKTSTSHELAKALLETYLGKISGSHVLDGVIERGHGRLIDCALWYCDLRGSTALAARSSLEDYLGTINDYFDCTAAAVLDHGGEVLKFIGDAVMAIFPFEGTSRPPPEMCRAALMTAQEALGMKRAKNSERGARNLAPIDFGIALHVGQVMYGNVGTERRLDFTVTGPAANEATRLESLCKKLQIPLVISSQFKDIHGDGLAPLGRHEAAGIAGGLEVFTLAELSGGPRTAANL